MSVVTFCFRSDTCSFSVLLIRELISGDTPAMHLFVTLDESIKSNSALVFFFLAVSSRTEVSHPSRAPTVTLPCPPSVWSPGRRGMMFIQPSTSKYPSLIQDNPRWRHRYSRQTVGRCLLTGSWNLSATNPRLLCWLCKERRRKRRKRSRGTCQPVGTNTDVQVYLENHWEACSPVWKWISLTHPWDWLSALLVAFHGLKRLRLWIEVLYWAGGGWRTLLKQTLPLCSYNRKK